MSTRIWESGKACQFDSPSYQILPATLVPHMDTSAVDPPRRQLQRREGAYAGVLHASTGLPQIILQSRDVQA